MKKITTDILIIGAGPAGLSCAMELSRQSKDFIILEKDERVGGLSKTYSFTEPDGLTFYTDNGPHRFFSKNPYLYEFIEGLIDEKWIKVRRQTRQYIDGKFYDYPINAFQALSNIGIWKASRMVIDYIYAKIVFGIFRKSITNFEDYVVANFGRSLGEFNMINYTEKIWGIPAKDIHADWASQRIRGLNLFSVLKDVLTRSFKKKSQGPKSLVDEFYFPEQGTGLIYETIQKKLENQGYKIYCSSYPTSIKISKNQITKVIASLQGEEVEIEAQSIVESIPITQFLSLLGRNMPHAVFTASRKLTHRNQVYLFVTLNKEKITDDQWIYYPDKKIPFGRVSEMKNFSSFMSPPGKTSLFIEFFCNESDDIWRMNDKELFEYALPYIEGAKLFTRSEVRHSYVIRKSLVYPVYDVNYKEYLSVVKKYLDSISNLYYIGRPGRFRYNNQDHSLEMGMLAAKSLIDGVRYDIDAVGEEKEYYESGKIYAKN